jgi:Matrixin
LGDLLRIWVLGLIAGLAIGAAAGVAVAGEASNFKILKLEGNSVRWQKSGAGFDTPVVTYGLVSGAVDFPGARNCRKVTSLDGLTAASQVATSAMREEISAAFAMWESVAGISFREAADPAKADILIGAQVEPDGWAFADVFYDMHSPNEIKPISRSLVCLNPAKRWKIGFDGDLKTYDLRYTIAHEIGHAIGLDHPSSAGSIMGYRYEERFRDLQPGDVQGAVALYGPRATSDVELATDDEPLQDPARTTAARPLSRALGTRALESRSP